MKSLLTIAAILAVFSTNVMAQRGEKPTFVNGCLDTSASTKDHSAMDTNGDGCITEEELKANKPEGGKGGKGKKDK